MVNPYNASINFDLSSQPIFGTRPETSSAFNSIKLTGYSVSLCFFIITLYVQLKEYKQISDEIKKKGTLTRKNKFSKRLDMLIGAAIVVGLMVLYSALLIRQIIDFEGYDVCKGEIHALATYTGYAGRWPLPWLACNVARALIYKL